MAAKKDMKAVPRPVTPAKPAPLIDISKAPSSLELRVAHWKGKR